MIHLQEQEQTLLSRANRLATRHLQEQEQEQTLLIRANRLATSHLQKQEQTLLSRVNRLATSHLQEQEQTLLSRANRLATSHLQEQEQEQTLLSRANRLATSHLQEQEQTLLSRANRLAMSHLQEQEETLLSRANRLAMHESPARTRTNSTEQRYEDQYQQAIGSSLTGASDTRTNTTAGMKPQTHCCQEGNTIRAEEREMLICYCRLREREMGVYIKNVFICAATGNGTHYTAV
ncbi:UNVERIFIED_CONTAM: hypothetical protein FKN15_015716 [Acipenser sinensis]